MQVAHRLRYSTGKDIKMEKQKTIQKSIRLKPEILQIIERQSGENFNDKLEKTIYKYAEEEKALDKRLTEKRAQLESMKNDLNNILVFTQAVKGLSSAITREKTLFERKLKQYKKEG